MDKCYICEKAHKHKLVNIKTPNDYGLQEVDFDVSHKDCIKKVKLIEKLKKKALDMEYQLFLDKELKSNEEF